MNESLVPMENYRQAPGAERVSSIEPRPITQRRWRDADDAGKDDENSLAYITTAASFNRT